MVTTTDVKNIVKNNNSKGFSVAVKGELKRYIIATTHNEFESIEGESIIEGVSNLQDISLTLTKQANENMYSFDNVTIGGWVDMKTGKHYIDAGMSTDDLDYAMNVAKYNNQIAIWDNKEQKEKFLR